MQEAIDRVMHAYGMMVNLTQAQELEAREKVSRFLANKNGDEHRLAIEGLKYLRGFPSRRLPREVQMKPLNDARSL